MNKKFKLAIPFAVLALTCGIAAGCDGCGGGNDGEHTHDYSAWGHNETQHWKECPDDHEKDESTIANHVFVAGECECGATEQTGPIEQAKYGTVTGKVKLTKNGSPVTDNTVLSGISVDLGDDKVDISGSAADGVYTFTVSDVKVGTTYDLTITCTGYKSYSTEILLEEEGEEVKIGGTNGITLEYEVFTFFWGFDTNLHDLSHINDADPTIGVNGDGGKTLNVISTDKYDDVSATIHAKSSNAGVIQGLLMRFEDGKAAIFNLKTDQSLVQFRPKTHGVLSIFDPNDTDKWMESPAGSVTDEEKAKFNGDGIDVTLTRKGGKLYAFLDGRYVYSVDLPEGYEDDKIQVGLFAFDVKANAVFSYNITDEVPAMQSALNISVTNPTDGTVCSVTANPQKDAYAFGEEVELTFTAPAGYKLNALTVGGEDLFSSVKDGKLKIEANKVDLRVEATFIKEEPIALNLAVKGTKLGTTAALAQGTTVKFKNTEYTFTVGADGKISNASVLKGRYTVQVDGYFEKDIIFDENLTEIGLEYNTFKEILGWGQFDFSKQNAAQPEFGITNDCSVIFTNETYGDVKSSIYLKGNNMNAGNGGLLFRFVGEGFAENGETVTLTMQGTKKVQFSQDNLWGKTTIATGCVWNNLYYFENCYDDDADRTAGANAAKYLEEYAAGTLKLSVIRRGATFYVFLDDTLIGQMTVDEKYADAKCEVGFLTASLGNTTEWKSWKVEISNDVALASYSITDETAADAHGRISGIPAEKVETGETVTLTVIPEEGYKLSSLTVNDINVTAQMNGSTYALVVTGDTTVVAEFAQIVPGSVNAVISGTKLGTTAALAEGTQVKLTCQGLEDITTQITAEGLVIDSIPAGEWTVNVQGYFPVQITVENETVYSQAIALEYDLFKIIQWDAAGHGFDHVNDEEPYVEWVSDSIHSLNAVSKECWLDDATVSVTIKRSLTTSGSNEQGLIVSFEDGKAAILNLNTDGTPRLQFRPNLFDNIKTAFTDEWVEFKNVTQAELDKYNSDTGIVLKIARQGNLLYVYVDDTYHGTAALPEAYKTSKMGIGVYSFNAVNGAKWYFNVSDELPDVSVTVNTAEMQNGTVTVSENATLGSTVTITVNPEEGYILGEISVAGVELTTKSENTYTFVATEKTYTVTATFIEAPETQAEAAVTGIGLGAAAVDMNGKEVTFKSAGGAETRLTVEGGKVTGVLATGEYTVSCEGFYDLTATVEESGSFAEGTSLAFEKIIFAYNLINEPEYGPNRGFIGDDESKGKNVGDSSNAASAGKITAGDKGNTEKGIVYEWTTEQYKNVAITVTLKSGNGNQGLNMRFNNQQQDVRVRFENTKAQWIGAEWFWGTHAINKDRWDFGNGNDYANPMSDALLAKYNGEGLTLTLVRKGGMVYALIDGTIYSAQIISGYATADVRLAVFVENATNGYEIPFEISTDVDAILNAAKDPHNVLSVLGKWTVTDTTLAATGDSYAEFAPTEVSAKESLKINIAAKNSNHNNHTQGLIYRFDNGKWLAARIEHKINDKGEVTESYIQYSQDPLLPSDGGHLKGWTLVHNLSDTERTAFAGDGVELQLVRDGKCIYVMLGGNVIDKVVLGDEYAEMDGVIAATIQGGTGTAFAYEYKTGENVTVPQIYAVSASFDGAANGYAITLDKNVVAKDGKVTLTLRSDPDTLGWSSWSKFPTKISVNGVETELTVADFVSDGANKLHYTKELTITADTEIKVTIAQGTQVAYNASVNDAAMGSVKCDMETSNYEYYWNDGCTLTITAEEGYELESLVIGEGENQVTITTEGEDGWKKEGQVYTYSHLVTGDIKVVANFKAVTPAA